MNEAANEAVREKRQLEESRSTLQKTADRAKTALKAERTSRCGAECVRGQRIAALQGSSLSVVA